MTGLTELRELMAANNPVDQAKLIEGFAKVARNARVMSRKFAVLEEIKLGFLKESVTIEHPESAYDWENPDVGNQAEGDKEGDATDYADDSALDANIEAEGSDSEFGELELDFAIDDAGGDDDLTGETSHGDILPGEGSEIKDEGDGQDLPSADDEKLESVCLSHEMSKLCTEAEDMMSKLSQHVVSPESAGGVLKDMVTYLGGAMKTCYDLAATIAPEFKKSEYAGEGEPQDVGAEVEPEEAGDSSYIGKDDIDDVGESPDLYKLEATDYVKDPKKKAADRATLDKQVAAIDDELKKMAADLRDNDYDEATQDKKISVRTGLQKKKKALLSGYDDKYGTNLAKS